MFKSEIKLLLTVQDMYHSIYNDDSEKTLLIERIEMIY